MKKIRAKKGAQHKRAGGLGKRRRQERALKRIEHYSATLNEQLRTHGHTYSESIKLDMEHDIARCELQISILRGKLGIEE